MNEFLSSNIFALILGAVLTLVTTLLVNRNQNLSELDKELAHNRIESYKKIFWITNQLNNNLSPFNEIRYPTNCRFSYLKTGNKELRKSYCFPSVFVDYATFLTYKKQFAEVLNDNRIFLAQSVLNKMFFLDSYLGEIAHISNKKSQDYLQMMGVVLNNELSDMINDIELEIQRYLNAPKMRAIKNRFSETYLDASSKINSTDLYKLFIKNKNGKFGSFYVCKECEYFEKCDLDKSIKS